MEKIKLKELRRRFEKLEMDFRLAENEYEKAVWRSPSKLMPIHLASYSLRDSEKLKEKFIDKCYDAGDCAALLDKDKALYYAKKLAVEERYDLAAKIAEKAGAEKEADEYTKKATPYRENRERRERGERIHI